MGGGQQDPHGAEVGAGAGAGTRFRSGLGPNKGFYMQYAKDIGVFWGRYSEALPRGINGYPMFETVRIMHRADHVRAVAAIKRAFKV